MLTINSWIEKLHWPGQRWPDSQPTEVDDTSKICIVLVVILLIKYCLLFKLMKLFYYNTLVLHFVGPNTWTGGN
jgi:hypothetical protein